MMEYGSRLILGLLYFSYIEIEVGSRREIFNEVARI
jgi:hypothetical protein